MEESYTKLRKLVIIPAYNESECIKRTVDELVEVAPDFDYVVIDDKSTDTTLKICKENHINHLSLPTNLGIGGAVQTGYRYAVENDYDIAVQLDGDGQHDPLYLKEMARNLISENVDMVIGSRFIEKEGFQSTSLRRVGIKYFSYLIKLLTGQRITDPTSGLRMINREMIERFSEKYPRDYPEPESVVAVLKNGGKVVEIPVEMRERGGGTSSIHMKRSVYYMIKVTLAILIEFIRKH